MATKIEVKQYLAHWMQLGRKLVIADRVICMNQVIAGEHYTTLFEELWEAGECQPAQTFLEGSRQSLEDLFEATCEILSCPRCDLPVPYSSMGPRQVQACPCDDLKTILPNNEIPAPHNPVQTRTHLQSIHQRLLQQET